jgi:hypothetical protein
MTTKRKTPAVPNVPRSRDPDALLSAETFKQRAPTPPVDDSPLTKVKIVRGVLHIPLPNEPKIFISTNHKTDPPQDAWTMPYRIAQPGEMVELSANEVARLLPTGAIKVSAKEVKRLKSEHSYILKAEKHHYYTTSDADPNAVHPDPPEAA